MTTQELRDAYPGAADAVEGHERFFPPMIWDVIRASGETPPQALENMKEIADALILDGWDKMRAVYREQMNHPDFLKYVAAKMGAM